MLEWLRRLPEPKRAAWLAFVDFAVLLRVFCTFYGDKIVLLLSSLDKGADPKAQPRAIRAARKLLADWQAEQAAAKRSRKP